MAVTPLYIDDLAAKTTLSDEDLVIVGEGSNAKKMTVAKFKELIGINALNTKTTYDLSGDGTIIGVSCGKNRMVIFNGFNVTSNLPNSFELGEIFSPENTLPFPISVEAQGTGTLIVNTAGQCSVYSANLSNYITGKIYGVVSFLKN